MTTTERPLIVTPANWVLGPKQGEWTYDDYAAIPDDGQRYEVIDGVLYTMTAPSIPHQKVIGRIFRYLAAYVEDTELGQVFVAPLDVELRPRMVVQPDVLVILNQNTQAQIIPSRILGAPNLVVEVLSPSTAEYDRYKKRSVYARAGITEYWIVDPVAQIVELLLLDGSDSAAYRSRGLFRGKQGLPSIVVPVLQEEIRVEQFFR